MSRKGTREAWKPFAGSLPAGALFVDEPAMRGGCLHANRSGGEAPQTQVNTSIAAISKPTKF